VLSIFLVKQRADWPTLSEAIWPRVSGPSLTKFWELELILFGFSSECEHVAPERRHYIVRRHETFKRITRGIQSCPWMVLIDSEDLRRIVAFLLDVLEGSPQNVQIRRFTDWQKWWQRISFEELSYIFQHLDMRKVQKFSVLLKEFAIFLTP